MKRIFLLSAWGLLAICISTGAIGQAQPKQPTKVKEKSTTKEKDKLGDYDEIVIKRKGEKGGKVTVEIKGDDVFVNGKPLSDYDDDNISVRKNNVMVWNGNSRTVMGAQASPFRYRSGDYYTVSTKAFLGVSTEKDEKGVRITNVTDNSAAEKAGLKEDDIIIRVDDTKIEDHEQLSKVIGKHKPEEKVTVVYLRGGKEQKVAVTLGKNSYEVYAMPKMAPTPEMNFNFDNNFSQSFSYSGRPRIGIKAQDTEEGKGVKVLDINDESLAEKAGLKEGDIITEFDGKSINSVDELAEAAKGSREKSSISLKYSRDGKPQTAEIKIPKKLKTTNF